jgi:hypothetical protein
MSERMGLPVPTKSVCVNLLLTGEIVAGDFYTFYSMLRKNEPDVDRVTLISAGGDVAESLKI